MVQNKVIKILVDAHVFDNEHQGSRTYIYEVYKRLAQKPNVEVYLAAHDIKNLSLIFNNGSNVKFIKLNSTSSIVRLLFEFPKIIKKLKPDYAHFQYIVPPIKYCKYIVTTHDILFVDFPEYFPFIQRIFKKYLYKFSAKRSNLIMTVSSYSRDALIKHFNINPVKLYITPNGISENFFEEYNKTDSISYINKKYKIENYILFVGRLEPRKQQSLVLKLYINLLLYKQDIKLVFIGHESIYDKSLHVIIDSFSSDIFEKVHFLKDVSNKDLIEFYKAARLVLYPSKAEGFGIPPLEAASLKIPVLSSKVTAMSDFLFFAENLIDPANEEEIKNKILLNIKTPPSAFYLDGISKEIKAKYSWNTSVNVLYNLLNLE